MPAVLVNDQNYSRFMALVNPIFTADLVMARLLDLANAPMPGPAVVEAQRVSEPASAQGGEVRSGQVHRSTPPRQRGHSRQFAERAPRGDSLDRYIYYKTILLLLRESSGEERVESIKVRLFDRIRGQLTSVDLEGLPKNEHEPRWWNHARFGREWLVERDFLERRSGHGIWRLTKPGRVMADKLAQNFNDPTFPT